MYIGTNRRPNLINFTSLAIFLPILIFQSCYCIRFFIQPHQRRCLKQEMYANELAVGEYEISNLPGTQVDMIIEDARGYIALRRENIMGKGKFAVTSDDAGLYELCFIYMANLRSGTQFASREIYLDYRTGVEAKQDKQPFNLDILSEIEGDLIRVEELTDSIIVDFANLKKRERGMRNTNDSTNVRLFYQGVTSVIIFIALTSWQILYMRMFFKAKKLIE